MPFDPGRLTPFIDRMSSAEQAYDAALRSVAEAERLLATAPTNPAARTRLRTAQRALAASRAGVADARRTLDAQRLEALGVLTTSRDFLESLPGTSVLGLFPVGLEARLEPGRVRIRVWPDAISTSTHDARLTQTERDAAMQYWRAEATTSSDTVTRAAWRELANTLGVTRAAWAALALTPTNRAVMSASVPPVFPDVPLQDDEAPFVPRAGVLPDRWVAVGIDEIGRTLFEQIGAPIPRDLAVGLDTTPAEAAGLTNAEGQPIQLPQRMRWLTDFSLALQVGMAFDIPIAAEIVRLPELYVFGVRLTDTPAASADALAQLLTGHRFSRGLAVVPQNTPTNNSEAGGPGLPLQSVRIEEAFLVERRPRAFVPALRSNGSALARAFGVQPDVFARVAGSGATSGVPAEPQGFEPEAAHAMQTALWAVTLGSFLEDFLQTSNARAGAMRDYFIDHVRASGPQPAIRVGRQPYAMLPVTALTGFVPGPSEGIDPLLPKLLGAIRSWFGLLRTPAVFTGSPEDALRLLGRSLLLYAEATPQAPGSTNRALTLARTLQIATRRQIDDTWRTTVIQSVADGQPHAMTRPVVDDATRGELGEMAVGTPQALRARPLPASVLGRMVRQAALLEWSLFARGVVIPSVDVPSLRLLQSRAGSLGSIVYLDALIQAFGTAPPIGPAAPITPIGPLQPAHPGIGRLPPDLDGDGVPDPFPDPDPDPDPDPEPEPEPEPGEPEINRVEAQSIRTLVGSLAEPLASCPGAPRLRAFRDALARLAQFPNDRLAYELFGVLDVCNHRADAWFTSLASRRLDTLRQSAPQGIVIGGWGVLQDVHRVDAADPQQRAEFVHAPSLDQAAAAAVLRSGARRATAGGSGHADVDLSSRRVRLARWILDGVRNGRSISELLGVRFERALKGTPGEAHLATLRAQFQSVAAMGVIDGLALQQAGAPAGMDPSIVHAAEGVSAALDAVADALTAEAVYQIVRGQPESSLATIDRIIGGEQPPPLTVTETPAAGVRLTHRVAVVVPSAFTAPGWPSRSTPRGQAEPLLDAWCGTALGHPDHTTFTVEGTNESVSVPLTALRASAIDIVFACRDGAAELAERVVSVALERRPGLQQPQVRFDGIWKELTGMGRALAGVITHAEPLRADAFETPSTLPTAADEDLGDLATRASDAAGTLGALRASVATRTDVADAASKAAAFGIRIPGLLLGRTPTTEQLDALLAAIEPRMAAASTGSPRDRLSAVFGGELPGVVSFVPRDPNTLVTATTPPPGSLFGSEPHAPRLWLEAAGRVHDRTARLTDVLVRLEVRGQSSPALVVAQAPWTSGDRWIATSFKGTGGRAPTGRLSVVMHVVADVAANSPLGGLLVDAWAEVVPSGRHDTAMALRFNNASTRAPQVILLGVSPDPSKPWTTDTLVEILRQTMMLSRLRMQTSTMLSQAGHMPLALLGQRPGGTGISFTL